MNRPLDLGRTPCPSCGQETLRVEWRLVAKQVGEFSLSGQTMKVPASERPWLVCDSCDHVEEGKLG